MKKIRFNCLMKNLRCYFILHKDYFSLVNKFTEKKTDLIVIIL